MLRNLPTDGSMSSTTIRCTAQLYIFLIPNSWIHNFDFIHDSMKQSWGPMQGYRDILNRDTQLCSPGFITSSSSRKCMWALRRFLFSGLGTTSPISAIVVILLFRAVLNSVKCCKKAHAIQPGYQGCRKSQWTCAQVTQWEQSLVFILYLQLGLCFRQTKQSSLHIICLVIIWLHRRLHALWSLTDCIIACWSTKVDHAVQRHLLWFLWFQPYCTNISAMGCNQDWNSHAQV